MTETLLIGIGAQKAGTTWLADYLRAKQPAVHMPPVKEVHFFDNYFIPDFATFFEEQRLAGLKARVEALTLETVGDGEENESLRAWLYRFQAIKSPETYLEFLNLGRERQSIIADITPDYALLGKPAFEMMKSIHQNTKLVFILRNPADRFWSSLRFNRTYNPSFDLEGNFDRMLVREDFVHFVNYDRTIRAVCESFSQDNLYLDFYETLFSDHAIMRFCDWLGVPFVSGDYGDRSNAAIGGSMPEVRRRQAVQTYGQTYKECTARFGDAIPQSWRDDMEKYL